LPVRSIGKRAESERIAERLRRNRVATEGRRGNTERRGARELLLLLLLLLEAIGRGKR